MPVPIGFTKLTISIMKIWKESSPPPLSHSRKTHWKNLLGDDLQKQNTYINEDTSMETDFTRFDTSAREYNAAVRLYSDSINKGQTYTPVCDSASGIFHRHDVGSTSFSLNSSPHRSKSLSSMGENAGISIKKWWVFGWSWILSRKPVFVQDLEMNIGSTSFSLNSSPHRSKSLSSMGENAYSNQNQRHLRYQGENCQ